MDRRELLRHLAIGLPVAGLGGAALLRSQPALATGTPPTPIYVASQYGTDPVSVQSAINAAGSTGAGLIFEGVTFTVNNIAFGGSGGSAYPAFMIGLDGAQLAPSASASGVLISFAAYPPIGFEFGGFAIIASGTSITIPVQLAAGIAYSRFRDLYINGGTMACMQILGATNCEFARLQLITNISNAIALNIIPSDAQTAGVLGNVFSGCWAHIGFSGTTGTVGYGIGGNIYQISGNTFQGCAVISRGADDCFGFQLTSSAFGNGGNTFQNCYTDMTAETAVTGWSINSADNAYIACSSTAANTDIDIVSTSSSVFSGGQSAKVKLSASASGVVMIGQHGQTSITGNTLNNGNIFFTGTAPTHFAYDPDGLIHMGKFGTPLTPDSHTPSGPTVRALPVYNDSGTLLGYAPVYASKW